MRRDVVHESFLNDGRRSLPRFPLREDKMSPRENREKVIEKKVDGTQGWEAGLVLVG